MLVLSRRLTETIVLPGIGATIQVVALKNGAVRLGIDAPPEVKILRGELAGRAAEWSQAAPPAATPVAAITTVAPLGTEPGKFGRLVRDRLQIAGIGLGLLRGLLEAGENEEAGVILEKVDEELRMLRDRVSALGVGPASQSPGKAPKARRALLVEDNANERELMALFLRTKGFDVDTVGDGLDALNYLNTQQRPDVVLLDMTMPRCDGPTTVHRIRENPAYAGLKVFAVTGRSQDEFQLETGPHGIDRWFRKPIDPTILIRNVDQELECSPAQ